MAASLLAEYDDSRPGLCLWRPSADKDGQLWMRGKVDNRHQEVIWTYDQPSGFSKRRRHMIYLRLPYWASVPGLYFHHVSASTTSVQTTWGEYGVAHFCSSQKKCHCCLLVSVEKADSIYRLFIHKRSPQKRTGLHIAHGLWGAQVCMSRACASRPRPTASKAD